MNWYFLRHGQINSNLNKVYSGRSDEPLNACGLQQAHDSIEKVKNAKIDRIIASPLARTGQTATILASALGLKVEIEPAFNEMKFGPWEGRSEKKIAQQYPLEWALWNSSPHKLKLAGRETLTDLQTRVIDRMHDIAALGARKNILVVTHVAVIRVALLYAQNRPLSEYKTVEVGNCELFPLSLPAVAPHRTPIYSNFLTELAP